MTTKQRTVEENQIGACPYCDCPEYSRENMDMNDDAVFVDCVCFNPKCKKEFKETFRLRWQEWKE